MYRLHEPEIGKARRISGYLLSILPSIIIVSSGFAKIAGVEEIVQSMTAIQMGELTLSVGVLEILCVLIFWIPKTSNLGFFLLCSYTGGIIVGELAGGNIPIPGISVSILLYIGTMLRKPSLSGLGI